MKIMRLLFSQGVNGENDTRFSLYVQATPFLQAHKQEASGGISRNNEYMVGFVSRRYLRGITELNV